MNNEFYLVDYSERMERVENPDITVRLVRVTPTKDDGCTACVNAGNHSKGNHFRLFSNVFSVNQGRWTNNAQSDELCADCLMDNADLVDANSVEEALAVFDQFESELIEYGNVATDFGTVGVLRDNGSYARKVAARALGKQGGSARSATKAASSRENGRKGGRPPAFATGKAHARMSVHTAQRYRNAGYRLFWREADQHRHSPDGRVVVSVWVHPDDQDKVLSDYKARR